MLPSFFNIYFNLCYVLTKPMKKLNRNHIEEEDSSELLEILSQYTDSLKKKKSNSFDKYDNKHTCTKSP